MKNNNLSVQTEANCNPFLSKFFWMIYFVMIALPLHVSNNLLKYLSITGMISIFHLIVVAIACLLLLSKHSTKIKLPSFLMIIYSLLLIFSMYNGIARSHVSINNAIGDGSMYILAFSLIFVASHPSIKKKSLDEILLLTFHAMTINCCLNVVMYLTRSWSFWGLQDFNGGRYGGGYYSLLIITIIYGFYDFMNQKKIKVWEFILAITTATIGSVLLQSRTHVILIVIGCIIVMFLGSEHRKISYFIKVIFICIIGAVGIYLFVKSNNDLVKRILSTDVTSNTETTASRLVTWMYYWSMIKRDPFGKGFGYIMYFITPHMMTDFSTSTYCIDNAIAVVFTKGGWLFGLLYLYFISKPLLILWKERKYRNDKLPIVTILTYIMLLFAVLIMSSQAIHTYAIMTFVWTFAGNCLKIQSERRLINVLNNNKKAL